MESIKETLYAENLGLNVRPYGKNGFVEPKSRSAFFCLFVSLALNKAIPAV